MTFTHLHVHSNFSFLTATPHIDALIERAVENQLTAFALTDNDGLFGAVRFHRKALKQGILPIIGLTAPVATGHMIPNRRPGPDRILLLARNRRGYSALSQIASYLQADENRATLLKDGLSLADLARFGEGSSGIIPIIGGLHSSLSDYANFSSEQHNSYLKQFRSIFQDQLYFALEYPDRQPEIEHQAQLAACKTLDIQPVATRPIYHLDRQERSLLKLLKAIDLNLTIDKIDERWLPHHGRPDIDLSWCPPSKVEPLYADYPEALESIDYIINACEPSLPDGSPIWPAIKLPDSESPHSALTDLVKRGVYRRFGPQPKVYARLEKELALIEQHRFAPLFLILADVVRFAREQKIPFISRGSVANSLVAYGLGITNVDPIKHDLYFERFLNPARTSLPDIDLDFDSRLRDHILDYIRQTYGVDQVALISTINFFRGKSAARETAKALGLPRGDIDMLAEAMPHIWAPSPELRKAREVDMLTFLEQFPDPRHQEALTLAAQINGLPSHLGLHPGGVVIAPEPGMRHYAPLQFSPKGYLATQFDHYDVEALGLVKVDILGIRALSVIRRSLELIHRQVDPTFDIEEIDPDDQATGTLLSRGETVGCFQAESWGAASTLRKLKAKNNTDLATCNAFFKPGPVLSGMANDFVARYRGEKETAYMHPALEPILNKTCGTILFQEQVLRICVEVAHLDWVQANQMRKGISKFQKSMLEELELRFKQGCIDQSGMSRPEADQLWDQIISFAGYGFNQGHATAYAVPTYQMAYLKTHFPAQFLSARMSEYGGYYPQSTYIAETRRLGMRVMPPSINHSLRHFSLTLAPEPIHWMGLNAIRDLRKTTMDQIIKARQDHLFDSIGDLMRRVSFQPKEIEHLIRSGGADQFGPSRAVLLQEALTYLDQGGGRQMALFDFQVTVAVEPESVAERYAWEQAYLGIPVSVHPLDLLEVDRSKGSSLRELQGMPGKTVWTLGCKLPGWTGLRRNNCFFDDGDAFVMLKHGGDVELKSWRSYAVKGSWQTDRWGGGWLEAERVVEMGDDRNDNDNN